MAQKKEQQMTAKQRLFALEYLIDFNGKQAAIRAGYSPRTAEVQACRLLRNAKVKAFIEANKRERTENIEVSVENILRELLIMGHYDPADFCEKCTCPADIAKLPEHVRRAIAGWSWDKQGNFVLKFHDKKSVLELLGKYKSMWTEKHDHNHSGDAVFTMVYQQPKDETES